MEAIGGLFTGFSVIVTLDNARGELLTCRERSWVSGNDDEVFATLSLTIFKPAIRWRS
jgi:hypothetical protein